MLENIGDFSETHFIAICVIFFVGLGVFWMVKSFEEQSKSEDIKLASFIKSTGYERGDVEVFIELMGFDLDDIIKSQAVRRQLQMFVDGEKSFYPEAQNRKANQSAESAKSSASTAQIMSTVALVNSMNKR